MRRFDVLVVGAGLAGLHTARRLARHDLSVLVVDKRRDLSAGIRTTGIFVRRTLDDFRLPPHLLGPGVRDVLLYPPSRRDPVRLTSARDEYRVADMAGVYAHARRAAETAGAEIRLGVRYDGDPADLGVSVRFVIGADGARSRVARHLGLDRNRHFLTGAELVHPVASGSAPAFHCVIDPRVAPGYLGWVIDDGHHAHVGVAGYPRAMRAGVRHLLDRFAADAPGRSVPTGPVERRGGPIPVGGVLRRIACPAGLLVGDAAGAVSPLTAGGLDPCLRMAELAAEVTAHYLRTGDHSGLRGYSGFRGRFRGRLLMRRLFAGVRTTAAAEAALALTRTPWGRAAARRVLFGDGSFPEVSFNGQRLPGFAPVPRVASPSASGPSRCPRTPGVSPSTAPARHRP